MRSAQQTRGNHAVQRYLRPGGPSQSRADEDRLSGRIEAASGSGEKLRATSRAELEEALGADLSDVRVHTDREADSLSRSVGAVAFTSGRDIFFRQGAYDPHSSEGLRLLAHEATHAVQQAAGPVDGTPMAGRVSVSDPSDRFERAAEKAAEAVASGHEAAGQLPALAALGSTTGSGARELGTVLQRVMGMPEFDDSPGSLPESAGDWWYGAKNWWDAMTDPEIGISKDIERAFEPRNPLDPSQNPRLMDPDYGNVPGPQDPAPEGPAPIPPEDDPDWM